MGGNAAHPSLFTIEDISKDGWIILRPKGSMTRHYPCDRIGPWKQVDREVVVIAPGRPIVVDDGQLDFIDEILKRQLRVVAGTSIFPNACQRCRGRRLGRYWYQQQHAT